MMGSRRLRIRGIGFIAATNFLIEGVRREVIKL